MLLSFPNDIRWFKTHLKLFIFCGDVILHLITFLSYNKRMEFDLDNDLLLIFMEKSFSDVLKGGIVQRFSNLKVLLFSKSVKKNTVILSEILWVS